MQHSRKIWSCQKNSKVNFLGSNGLFCFISIWKFGCLKNPSVMITSLSELDFRTRRFILLVQTKKVFLWTMAAAQDCLWQQLECLFKGKLSFIRFVWIIKIFLIRRNFYTFNNIFRDLFFFNNILTVS